MQIAIKHTYFLPRIKSKETILERIGYIFFDLLKKLFIISDELFF